MLFTSRSIVRLIKDSAKKGFDEGTPTFGVDYVSRVQINVLVRQARKWIGSLKKTKQFYYKNLTEIVNLNSIIHRLSIQKKKSFKF